MNVYTVDEYWDNKEGNVIATTYGVFTSLKQAFYALYELINHRLLAYRSNGNQVVLFVRYNVDGHQVINATVYDYEYNNEIEYFITSFEMDTVHPSGYVCFAD